MEDAIVANTGVADFSTFVADFISTASDYVQTEMTFNYGLPETDTGSTTGSDHGGVTLNAEDVINEADADDTDGQPLQGFNVIFPGKKEQVSSIIVHTGANAGQGISIDLQDMRAGALGINSSDPFDISSYDKAIEKVASYRSELGSYENRLEHTINNLKSSHEKLTNAESRIRDVNIAKELMNQTKNSILAQASQAMLAQANQLPNGVLQLLY
ncbi:flagellin [Paraliobacillus zengyii]|uniref:flagellin n=1 Tax=Paraliobacillus zengyii TaxID=2213194 RepID=UPI001E42FDE6|nr:flagellin [Paraliobacillus zengyii]